MYLGLPHNGSFLHNSKIVRLPPTPDQVYLRVFWRTKHPSLMSFLKLFGKEKTQKKIKIFILVTLTRRSETLNVNYKGKEVQALLVVTRHASLT